jgi:hypothetical protein
LDVLALENPTGSPEVIQGVTLAAHSLYVAVVGGEAADIAQTIWTKKDPGCNYNGNTTIDVQDTNPGYSEPYPTYPVTFEIPPGVSTTFNVTLFNNPQVPSNVVTLVQNAVMAAFTGADGGSRAGIGATIFASRYYGGVATLGSWANIISLGVGTAATADAVFTASVSGTTLDVTAVSTGTLLVGADVFNTGTVAIAPGSFIVSQLTGSTGSTGTYQLAAATTTVASEGMVSVSPVQNVVTLNANQVPTLQLADVNVTLSGTV